MDQSRAAIQELEKGHRSSIGSAFCCRLAAIVDHTGVDLNQLRPLHFWYALNEMESNNMRPQELYPGDRLSGAFVPVGRSEDVHRRIDSLIRIKAMGPARSPRCEQDFRDIINNARLAADSGNADAIAAAGLALDLLSLELCDD